MSRAEYMLKFTQRLGDMPDERKQEILEDIIAHFSEGAAQGIPEEVLAEGLGSPEALAREYRATVATEKAKEQPSLGNVMRAVWAGIGMGMLNLIFALPIVAAAFAVWFSLLASGAAMGIAGALAFLLSLVDVIVPLAFVASPYPLVAIFGSVAIAAFGALLFIGALYTGRWMGRGLVRYVQANIEIIAGRRKRNAQEN